MNCPAPPTIRNLTMLTLGGLLGWAAHRYWARRPHRIVVKTRRRPPAELAEENRRLRERDATMRAWEALVRDAVATLHSTDEERSG